MKVFLFFFMGWLAFPNALYSQQKIDRDSLQKLDTVHIDTKVSINRKNSGKVVTVLDAKTLQQNVGKTVAQVLSQVAGFEINGNQSNNGQNLGYFVRGGKNRQVLIVVDGVPINDASQIANDYDLRMIPLASIEKIEILKGASSVLYGSGAATAVISISTQKAANKPFRLQTNSIFGTDRATEDSQYKVESLANNVSLSGTLNQFFYQAEATHQYNTGLSAIEAPEGEEPFDEDIFNQFYAKATLGLRLNKKITMSQFISKNILSAGFDDFGYTDAPYKSTSDQWSTGGNLEWKYKKGVYVFNDHYSVLKREIFSSFPARYDSKVYHFDNYLQHTISSSLKAIVGLGGNVSKMNSFSIPFGETQFTQEINEDTAKFSYFDPYLNLLYTSSFGLNLNTGARLNIHSVYENHMVYQVNPSYHFDFSLWELKLMGSYSTAYITPSLFQLNDPIYGNKDLLPEENSTLEGGFEISKSNLFRLSAVYFRRKEINFVDFVLVDEANFSYQYKNTNDTYKTNGIEIDWKVIPAHNMQISFNYTFTQPDTRFALRIPKHKVNAMVSYAPTNKLSLGLGYQYVSDRQDSFFNSEIFENEMITLAAYSLFHGNANWRVTPNVQLHLGIDNILDTEFEELYRYQTKGRNVRMGIELDL